MNFDKYSSDDSFESIEYEYELFSESSLLTLDSDFVIYRKNINQVIPVIRPES